MLSSMKNAGLRKRKCKWLFMLMNKNLSCRGCGVLLMSLLSAKLKTDTVNYNRLLCFMSLLFLTLLYFTNPKQFAYRNTKETVHNSTINRIERMLEKVQLNVLKRGGKEQHF